MRCLVRLILGLTIFCGSAAAHVTSHSTPLNKLPANPRSARILSINTPLDPQRKVCVPTPAEDVPRASGHRMDQRVLKYLRVMIGICRRKNRRDMVWYYSDAWEFATVKIYGPLPPRPQFNMKGLENPPAPPQQIVTPWPAGAIRPATRQMPLRKIVKRFTRSHNRFDYTYETLECAHILMGPFGYSVPVKSRRCPHCAIAAISKKKKPAVSAASAPRTKAVTA